MTQKYRTDLSQKTEVQRSTIQDWQQSAMREVVFINFSAATSHGKMMLYDDAYISTSYNTNNVISSTWRVNAGQQYFRKIYIHQRFYIIFQVYIM